MLVAGALQRARMAKAGLLVQPDGGTVALAVADHCRDLAETERGAFRDEPGEEQATDALSL